MNKYKELAETYFKASKELHHECINHIKNLLKERKDNKIFWDYQDLEDYGLDPISIGYDGGNHPEYASNMFSEVESVSLADNGFILVRVEDGEMYAEHIYNAAELYDLCDFLDCLVKSMDGENDFEV